MGFINKLLGGLFSFLGGIFKIFNIFKKSEYFLEADDSSSAVSSAAASAAQATKAGAKAPAPTPIADQPIATKAAPATKETKKVEALPVVSQAERNGKAPEKTETIVVTQAPTSGDLAAKAAAPAKLELFAPNYLVSTNSGSRRRPGPSLNRFLDMAKQVKA